MRAQVAFPELSSPGAAGGPAAEALMGELRLRAKRAQELKSREQGGDQEGEGPTPGQAREQKGPLGNRLGCWGAEQGWEQAAGGARALCPHHGWHLRGRPIPGFMKAPSSSAQKQHRCSSPTDEETEDGQGSPSRAQG